MDKQQKKDLYKVYKEALKIEFELDLINLIKSRYIKFLDGKSVLDNLRDIGKYIAPQNYTENINDEFLYTIRFTKQDFIDKGYILDGTYPITEISDNEYDVNNEDLTFIDVKKGNNDEGYTFQYLYFSNISPEDGIEKTVIVCRYTQGSDWSDFKLIDNPLKCCIDETITIDDLEPSQIKAPAFFLKCTEADNTLNTIDITYTTKNDSNKHLTIEQVKEGVIIDDAKFNTNIYFSGDNDLIVSIVKSTNTRAFTNESYDAIVIFEIEDDAKVFFEIKKRSD